MFRAALSTCILAGIGMGILSCIFFLWTSLIGTPPASVLWTFILGYPALAIFLWKRANKHASTGSKKRHGLYALAFALVCLYVGTVTITKYLENHHGDWDAWAIWNLHARLLFRGGAEWLNLYTHTVYEGHQDYPLLLPSLVAAGWTMAGSESTLIPASLGALFTFGVVVLLVSSVSFFSGDARGFAIGLVLIGTTDFIWQGSGQMADVPLGFFILLTIVLLHLSDKSEPKNFFLALSGMSAGFAAWTKNEGLLFIVCLVCAHFLANRMYKLRAAAWRETTMFLCGLIPVLLIVFWFKFLLAPPNDIFQDTSKFFGRLQDPSRYREVSSYFLQAIVAFGAGPISPLIAAGNFLVCFGRPRSNSTRAVGLLLMSMFAGYFMIYIITPQDLQWHLRTSLNRLLLHLWPACLFCLACTDRRAPHDFSDCAEPDRPA
jgi:4-amino-4-deoxy-L-arabinose transferase-like glycosyltransferase